MASTPTFEHALIQRLNADAAVTTLVGDRISAGALETDPERPYVTLRRLATDPGNTLDNQRNAPTQALIEVASYGLSRDAAIELAQAVRSSLAHFRGTITVAATPVTIKSCLWTDERDFEPGIGAKTYRRHQVYDVWGDE